MTVTVVIPALDEEGRIGASVRRVLETADCAPGAADGSADSRDAIDGSKDSSGVDVVVVDGGSGDATAERARQAGARVVAGPRGRGRQLQRGVEASDGDPLLFLHADTRLPPGWVAAVDTALSDPAVVGGAFRLCFDDPGARFRLLEWGVRLRVGLFGLPYGDQAIFVRRGVLDAIGGVPDAPVMEDLDLVAALKREGRLAILSEPVVTSARRYRERGVARTVLQHAVAATAWRLGVDRSRVRRWLGR